jgi:hypothetical protein
MQIDDSHLPTLLYSGETGLSRETDGVVYCASVRQFTPFKTSYWQLFVP